MSASHVRAVAARAALDHAASRGMLTPQQLAQVSAVAARAAEAGDPAPLAVLAALLAPPQLAELRAVYERALAGESAAATPPSAADSGARPRGGSRGPGPGDPVGPYLVERELARGGMGVVYVGRHAQLGRRVALKLMLAPGLAGAGSAGRTRFAREAQAVAALDHPSVVRLHEVGEHDGHPFMAMELIEGASLANRLEGEGPLPVREAAALVEQVARALQHAHDRGVLHRDLKPANVLVDREGRPKVTDFGLARLADERERLTRTGQMMGTPAFMPPEQVTGHADQIGPASDVYGLGATLYALLAGEPPFSGDSAFNVIARVMRVEPEPLRTHRPEVGAELEAVVARCLEKAPQARYPAPAALADDLRRWLEGRPVLARPPSRAARLRKWAGRHRALLRALVVSAALVGGGLTAGAPALRARLAGTADTELARLVAAGERALAEGDTARAIRLFAQASDLEPSPALQLRLGQANLAHGRLDPARRELEAALAGELAGEARREALQALVEIADRQGDAAAALARLDALVALDPTSIELRVERAARRERLGDPAGAAADLTEALALLGEGDPARRRALVEARVRLRRAAGEWAQALRELDALLAERPGEVELLFARAEVQQMLGDHAGAIASCSSALALDPRSYRGYLISGRIGVRAHRRTAAQDLDRAIELRPTLAEAYALRARVAAADGVAAARIDELLEQAMRASEGGDLPARPDEPPEQAELRRARALTYATRAWTVPAGKRLTSREALELSERALGLDPLCDLAHTVRAEALLARRDPQGALLAIDRAVSLAPIDVDARVIRARVLQAVGRREEAVAECRWVFEAAPWNNQAIDLWLDLLVELGRPAEALVPAGHAVANALARVEPDARNRPLAAALARRAELHLAAGAPAHALADVERAREADINSWKALRLPALREQALTALAAEGDPLEVLDRTIGSDPSAWPLRLVRANLQAERGAIDAALADLRELQRLQPDYVLGYQHELRLLADAGRLEAAPATTARLLERCAGHSEAFARAAYFWLDRDPARAKAALDQGLLRHPEHPHLLRLRARARAALGDREGALADTRRALEVASATPKWRHLVKNIRAQLRRMSVGGERP